PLEHAGFIRIGWILFVCCWRNVRFLERFRFWRERRLQTDRLRDILDFHQDGYVMLENRAQDRSSQYVESGIDWFEWSCEKRDFCAFEHAGFDSAAEHFIFSGICTDI